MRGVERGGSLTGMLVKSMGMGVYNHAKKQNL